MPLLLLDWLQVRIEPLLARVPPIQVHPIDGPWPKIAAGGGGQFQWANKLAEFIHRPGDIIKFQVIPMPRGGYNQQQQRPDGDWTNNPELIYFLGVAFVLLRISITRWILLRFGPDHQVLRIYRKAMLILDLFICVKFS